MDRVGRGPTAVVAFAVLVLAMLTLGLVSVGTHGSSLSSYSYDHVEQARGRAALIAADKLADDTRRGGSSAVLGRANGYNNSGQDARALPRLDDDRLAPNTAAGLAARADEVHGALDPIAQTHRTTAALGTTQGRNVLAGGVRDLTPAQRALARPGEVLGRLPGEHAEITALKAAGEAGLTPQGIATTTNICPACRAALEEAGATITGPRSAWWGSL